MNENNDFVDFNASSVENLCVKNISHVYFLHLVKAHPLGGVAQIDPTKREREGGYVDI
jgi:hypothetical protein